MPQENRPPIPQDIKREVRQRCGFGCVICGLPLYEYEHMLEWAEVERHVAEEITLLCRQHHGEKTNGLLPIDDVQEANRNPYNFRSGVSRNLFLRYSGNDVQLALSNSTFRFNNLPENAFFAPLVVDGMAIVGFRVESERLLLHFSAFNEFNSPILQIVDNELVYRTDQWDIEWVGQKLTIREGHRKILIQLVFEPPNIIRIAKGRILFNGIEILIGSDYIFCSNNSCFLSSINTVNCAIGLAIGDPTPQGGAGIVFSGIPRYGFDRKEARKFLRKSKNEMRARKSLN